jgi:hypothetical protein
MSQYVSLMQNNITAVILLFLIFIIKILPTAAQLFPNKNYDELIQAKKSTRKYSLLEDTDLREIKNLKPMENE